MLSKAKESNGEPTMDSVASRKVKSWGGDSGAEDGDESEGVSGTAQLNHSAAARKAAANTATIPHHDESALSEDHGLKFAKHASFRSSAQAEFVRKRALNEEAGSHHHEFPPPSKWHSWHNDFYKWRRESSRMGDKVPLRCLPPDVAVPPRRNPTSLPCGLVTDPWCRNGH